MPKHTKTKGSVTSVAKSKRVRYVPFARGFKRRDEHARLQALGYEKAAKVPKEFSSVSQSLISSSSSGLSATASTPLKEFFRPVPQPTSQDDWLAQYDEDGQTYRQFLEENPWMSPRKVKYIKQDFRSKGETLGEKYPEGKVCVLQIGQTGQFDRHSLSFADILDYCRRFLGLPVEQLPPLDLEVSGGRVTLVDDPVQRGNVVRSTRLKRTQLTARFNSSSGHLQLRVDSVLSKLGAMIPPQALCLIALTTMDLYADNSDLFVAGMAAGNQRVAVFSLLRYDPCLTFSSEHWFQINKTASALATSEKSRLMIQRSCKLVVHEILHLLGVDHCVFFDCCMNGSGHLDEDFRQPMHLCPVDLRKLQTLVGFDVLDRYRSLLEFYRRHGLTMEADWVQQRLQFLSS